MKQRRSDGIEEVVVHKEPISDQDWELLKQYHSDILTTDDPRKLTAYVWMVVTSHFRLRRGEVQAKLRVHDLVFDTNDDGEDLVKLNKGSMLKNHNVAQPPPCPALKKRLSLKLTKKPKGEPKNA